MGQKVNPHGMRVGIISGWDAQWYANKKDYAKFLNNDIKIREYFEKNLKDAAIAKVQVERNSKRTEVIVHTAKPGVIIGRGGEAIEKLKQEISKLVNEEIQISIVDIKKADICIVVCYGLFVFFW